MSQTSININRFTEQFNREYSILYDIRDCVAWFDEAVDAFDSFIMNEENAAFVREFEAFRGDVVSSDREAAAFMFALEALTGE